jgi:hypothetical protein
MESQDRIDPTELKRLLITVKEHSTETKIRFRTIGKMWDMNFARIIQVTEHDILVVQVEGSHKLSFIPINDVAQFEMEDRFQNFRSFNHYTVKLPLTEATR